MMHKPHHLTRYTDEPREPQESADPRRWKALAVLSLAQLMLILDLTVVNVALPNLGADLDLSRTTFTWAVSAYTLFFGGVMLLGGRFADVFGSRPVILTGLVIFTLASLASGLAQNVTLLISGRIVYLARVVVLKAVDEVRETSTDALRLLDHIFVGHFGVVAWRHEPRDRLPERPHSEAVFHGVHVPDAPFRVDRSALSTLPAPSLLAAPDGAATYPVSVGEDALE